MKVYISGPITGIDAYMERFNIAEIALVAAGHTVINPARVNAALPEGTTHEEYMKTSIAMLEMCDCIFMLEGWKESKGCSIEFQYAYENGLTIVFEGGRGCQKNQSKPKQENLAEKQGSKSSIEMEVNVSSAKWATRKKEQHGLGAKLKALCIIFPVRQTDLELKKMER